MSRFYITSLFFIIANCLLSQSIINGIVQNEAGESLPGVNVYVPSTGEGDITDIQGNFTVTANKSDIIQISLVGYESMELTAAKASNAVLVLNEGINLSEVVVTALGIKRDKDALAYAHSEVTTEPLQLARANNFGDALSGLVPGLNVSDIASGPSGSTRLTIRGYHSVSQDNQPLIVVDGIPIDNSTLGSATLWGGQDWGDGLTSINPDDIAKISVLRGNAATALYGSRASNGVILLTTKQGSARKGIGVEINSNYTIEQALDHTDYQRQYGQGWGPWKPDTQADAFSNNWFNWGPRLDGEPIVQFDGVVRPYAAVNGNFKNFYKDGHAFNNSLALTGGDEQLNFRFGYSNLENDFVLPHSSFQRNTFSLAVGGEVIPRLTTKVSARYSIEATDNRPRLADSPGNANYALAVLPPNVPVEALKGENGDGSKPDGLTELGMNVNPYITNPYWAINRFSTDDSRHRIIGSIQMRYDLDWLYLQGRLGTDFYNSRRTDLTPFGTAYQLGGSIIDQTFRVSNSNADFILGTKHQFERGFGYDIFVGANRLDYSFENTGLSGTDFNIQGIQTVQNTSNQGSWYNLSNKRVNSVFGAVNLKYNNWLYVSVTGRNDWFSTLPTNANNIFYPSVGTSLILSELVELPNLIDYAKIYTSWAQVGGDVDPYALDLTYQLIGQGFQGQPLGTINSFIIPDRALAPSISQELELGVDLKLFKNRLGIEAAWYDRQTKNDIIVSTISNTSGYEQAYIKDGAIQNKGIEGQLTITPIKSKNAQWQISLNGAYNWNEVTNLGAGADNIQIDVARTFTAYLHHEVGQPASVIKGFAYQRDENGNIVMGENGYPLQGNFKILGQGVHPFAGGVRNIIQWRNLALDVLLDTKIGGDIYSATNAYAYIYGQHKNTLPGREEGFTPEGVATDGTPNKVHLENHELLGYYSNLVNTISEEFVYDADFVKLRRVSLSYTLPQKWLNKMPFQSMTISAVGRNLALLYSKVPNVDPESTYNNSNAQGLEMFGAPQTRTFGGNLQIKF